MKWIAIIGFVMTAVACGAPTADTDLIELQRVRAGDLDVVLLSNDGHLTDGKDALVIEFRRGDDLVDVGTVTGFASMPMAGLPDMMGSAFFNRSEVAGRYTTDTELSMSGGWELKVQWDGPAGQGKVSIPVTAE